MSTKDLKIFLHLPAKTDRDAYEQLFREFFPRLLAYSELFVDTETGRDIVQDLLVYIWDNSETLQIHTSLEAYLFRSVYFRCLNHLRHQQVKLGYSQKVEKEFLEFEARFFHPDQNEAILNLFREEQMKDIESALDKLGEKCRQAFVMSYMHDMKCKDIAQVMNISERTVETHIYNALKILRELLGKKSYFGLLMLWTVNQYIR